MAYVTGSPSTSRHMGNEERPGLKSDDNIRLPGLPGANGLSHPGKKLVVSEAVEMVLWIYPSTFFPL